MLWCEFLMDQGLLDRAAFAPRNAEMARQYQAGTVGAAEFCAFYVSTLSARSRADWQPWRRRFLDEVIAPRIAPGAPGLVQRHIDAGDLVVMTTATNRFITELTAAHLGLPHLIATECETTADGEHFTGRPAGLLNMREGKVARLHAWLAPRRIELQECESTLYSDSINDLPLLQAVRRPVAVDPDARLAREAVERGWRVMSLRRAAGST